MAEIVILGAGLTGLSAAYHLEKKGFFDYKIFEKEPHIGGLCRSVQQDGFTFDYTGHLLHVSDPYFKSFLANIVHFENLNTIARRSFIYSQECYTRYPYQVNLHGLPPTTIAACIEGFVNKPKSYKQPQSFYKWVLQNFGAGFAEYFFFPYQSKIFAYPVKKLSASWTGRFVPSTSLNEMLLGALRDNPHEEIGYNAQFFYPKTGGIFFWINKLYQQLKQPVFTQFCVSSIDSINKIIYFTNGSTEQYKQLITTIPLDQLLLLIQEPSSSNLAAQASRLLCNSVVNFNLGVNRPDLSNKHWIYYPEAQYPFYRIGFSHNFAQSMAPTGCSSLYGEFSYLHKKNNTSAQTLTEALAVTKKLFAIDNQEIITEKVMTINHAYVIYNSWRDKNLPTLLKQLEQWGIYSVGRYGAWKYSSMQEGLLDGKKVADMLVVVPAQQDYNNFDYQPQKDQPGISTGS